MSADRLELDLTENDLQDLLNGDDFEWNWTTENGVKIDIHVFNTDTKECNL